MDNQEEQNVIIDLSHHPKLMNQLNMISFNKEDLQIIVKLKPIIERNIHSIVDLFYSKITQQPNLLKIIEVNSSVNRLKQTLTTHVKEMFDGIIDEHYYKTRLQIARVHVRVGLRTEWYMSAFQELLNSIICFIDKHIENRYDLVKAIQAASKLLNFEQQIVLEAYEAENKRVLEEANQKLLELSHLDGLTSIKNRRYLSIAMQDSWEEGLLSGREIGLIMLDIDFFKEYNDYYGHLKGDDCLIRVASLIDDEVAGRGVVARYGGEEFAVLINDTNLDEIKALSQRLKDKVEDAKIEHEGIEKLKYVTVSIGFCVVKPDEQNDMEELLSRADQALYRSKSDGRNQIYMM